MFSWGLGCSSTFLQQEHLASPASVSGKPPGQATGYLLPFWAGAWLKKFGEVQGEGAFSQQWWPHLGICVYVLRNNGMHGRNGWVDSNQRICLLAFPARCSVAHPHSPVPPMSKKLTCQGDWGSYSCICFYFYPPCNNFWISIWYESSLEDLRIIWLPYISRGGTWRRNNLAEAGLGGTTVSLFSLSASSTVSCRAEMAYGLHCSVLWCM